MEQIGTEGYYILTNSIDCEGATLTTKNSFSGEFNGAGYMIYNVEFSGSAMFSTLETTAVVENIAFFDITHSDGVDEKSIVAVTNNGAIRNIYANAVDNKLPLVITNNGTSNNVYSKIDAGFVIGTEDVI